VTRRANTYVVAVLLLTGSVLTLPQSAWAGSGGSGYGATAVTQRTASPAPAAGTGGGMPTGNGNATVAASGNGITISARASAMLRSGLQFSGTVPSSGARDVIEVERLGRETNWTWTPTAHGTASSNGSFTALWPANHIGQFQIRAVIEGPGGASARAATPSPPVTITVYRPSIATWYGPGSWGRKTACGVTLKKTTLGVANRSLRCGVPVAVYYNGKTMIVPVIDRGPYANHADWDLTAATAQALGTYTAGVTTIGAVSLRAAPGRTG
jgi:rare lipoprotein A